MTVMRPELKRKEVVDIKLCSFPSMLFEYCKVAQGYSLH